MIKKFLLIGALALLASFSAQARLGYTLEQCIAAYGTPVEDDASEQNDAIRTVRGGSNYHEKVRIFKLDNEITIYVGFNRNVVIVESCVFPREITASQAKTFLNKMASGWKKNKEMSGDGTDVFNAQLNDHSLSALVHLDIKTRLIEEPLTYDHDAIESIFLYDLTGIRAMHDDLSKASTARQQTALDKL